MPSLGHQFMTVKELKAFLEKYNVPDDAKLVVPGRDHDYRIAACGVTTAIRSARGLDEDFGDEYMEKGDKRIKVLLVL